MHCDLLPKLSCVNCKKCVFSVLIMNLRTVSRLHWFFVTPLSIDINTLLVNFQMECIELQSKIWSCVFTRPERNILCLTVMSYSCHHFLAVPTFVSNCFQGWNIGRVKIHQKSLMNTWRTIKNCSHCHQVRQTIFTKTMLNIPLDLWFCCSIFYALIKNINN